MADEPRDVVEDDTEMKYLTANGHGMWCTRQQFEALQREHYVAVSAVVQPTAWNIRAMEEALRHSTMQRIEPGDVHPWWNDG